MIALSMQELMAHQVELGVRRSYLDRLDKTGNKRPGFKEFFRLSGGSDRSGLRSIRDLLRQGQMQRTGGISFAYRDLKGLRCISVHGVEFG
jgi:hypothetical protein